MLNGKIIAHLPYFSDASFILRRIFPLEGRLMAYTGIFGQRSAIKAHFLNCLQTAEGWKFQISRIQRFRRNCALFWCIIKVHCCTMLHTPDTLFFRKGDAICAPSTVCEHNTKNFGNARPTLSFLVIPLVHRSCVTIADTLKIFFIFIIK